MLRLQPYRYKVIHIAGSKNIADFLSQLFNENVIKNAENDNSIDEYVNLIVKYTTPIALITCEIEKTSNADKELRNLRNCILSNDWLKRDYKSYLPVRSELTTIGFIVLRGTRIVIPSKLRKHVLKLAHEGHPGIVMTKKRLRSKVWWSGTDKDSERFCKECYGCQLVSTSIAPEPINRKLRTKLPPLEMYCDYDFDVQKCRDNDAEMKEKGKRYIDVKRNAVKNDLKVGDEVLLKQNKSNKMSTVYRKDPFIITERKGKCVTVQNDDVCLKRNVTHVKRFNSCM